MRVGNFFCVTLWFRFIWRTLASFGLFGSPACLTGLALSPGTLTGKSLADSTLVSVSDIGSPRITTYPVPGLPSPSYFTGKSGLGKVRVELSCRCHVFAETSPSVFSPFDPGGTPCLTLFDFPCSQCPLSRIDYPLSTIVDFMRIRPPGSRFGNFSRARTHPIFA